MDDPTDKARTAWSIGRAFRNAFSELVGRGHPPGGIGDRAVPGVVCGAFAVELYLKCLLGLEGKTVKTHKTLKTHQPSKLLAHLSTRSKSHILKFLPANVGNEAELVALMKGLDTAFEDWRYVFERDSTRLSLAPLLAALYSLDAAILDLQPEWKGEESC